MKTVKAAVYRVRHGDFDVKCADGDVVELLVDFREHFYPAGGVSASFGIVDLQLTASISSPTWSRAPNT